jgi:hypothetical protein
LLFDNQVWKEQAMRITHLLATGLVAAILALSPAKAQAAEVKVERFLGIPVAMVVNLDPKEVDALSKGLAAGALGIPEPAASAVRIAAGLLKAICGPKGVTVIRPFVPFLPTVTLPRF